MRMEDGERREQVEEEIFILRCELAYLEEMLGIRAETLLERDKRGE